MENRFPEIQARHTRTSLEVLGELFPAAEQRVKARLSPLVSQAIEAAFRLDYLPVMVDLEVAAAIRAEVGPQGARQVAREGLRRTLNGTMLGGLVQLGRHPLRQHAARPAQVGGARLRPRLPGLRRPAAGVVQRAGGRAAAREAPRRS